MQQENAELRKEGTGRQQQLEAQRTRFEQQLTTAQQSSGQSAEQSQELLLLQQQLDQATQRYEQQARNYEQQIASLREQAASSNKAPGSGSGSGSAAQHNDLEKEVYAQKIQELTASLNALQHSVDESSQLSVKISISLLLTRALFLRLLSDAFHFR